MRWRILAFSAVSVLAVVLAGCTSPAPDAASSPTGASPSPSVSLSPSATATPTPSPSATTKKPVTPPTSAKPKPKPTAATGSVTATSLNVPGAGTLKIPAWPAQKGMRYRGPVGSQGSTGTSSVALTFDDGPGPYTSQILDVLDEYHVKATFCLIGRQIHAYKSVVKRMIKDGMTLCDHTWDHNEKIGKDSATVIAKDMQRPIDAIHAIDPHATMDYFRNPGGNFTKGTVRISELLGMRPLYWSVDTDDWTRPGVAAIEKTLMTKTHRDSVVLMHDGGGDRSETVAALKAELPTLKAKFHLIALPSARVVSINPGSPPPTHSPAPPPPDADMPLFASGSRS